LGSNIGDGTDNLTQAIAHISNTLGIELTLCASYYRTKPWGKLDQQDFINTVIEINTHLNPQELLIEMQNIELIMGRIKSEKWGPRLIDIDILLYSDSVVNQPHLKIPHPFLTERSFVLIPLFEINQALFIPNKGDIGDYIDKNPIKSGILKI